MGAFHVGRLNGAEKKRFLNAGGDRKRKGGHSDTKT